MSNSQHHRALLETLDGKKCSATGGRSKFDPAGDRLDPFNKSAGCQDELNNNSIILPEVSVQTTSVSPVTTTTLSPSSQIYANQHHLQVTNKNISDFKHLAASAVLDMDQYGAPKSSPNQKESTTRLETNLNTLSGGSEAPSYPILLNSAPNVDQRRAHSPPGKSLQKHPGTTQRLPLKKQPLALGHESSKSSFPSGKRISATSYDSGRYPEGEEPEDEEEESDDDGDDDDDDDEENEKLNNERLPFSINRLRSSGKLNGETHRAQKMPAAGKQPVMSYNSNKKAHTRISMHDGSKPPSFHSSYHPDWMPSRKLEWQNNGHSCSCVSSQYLKSGLSQADWRNLSAQKKPSKTKSMHLVLKSIILILLTLILAMLLMGFLAASHYLPQMFDKLLSASRSFNVTISG